MSIYSCIFFFFMYVAALPASLVLDVLLFLMFFLFNVFFLS